MAGQAPGPRGAALPKYHYHFSSLGKLPLEIFGQLSFQSSVVFKSRRVVTVGGMAASHSAGTADIAKDSGGDVMEVDNASAFEDTLERLRQRYVLYFYWPPGPANPEQRLVTLALGALRVRSSGKPKFATAALIWVWQVAAEAEV
jgi:hypothetical protein